MKRLVILCIIFSSTNLLANNSEMANFFKELEGVHHLVVDPECSSVKFDWVESTKDKNSYLKIEFQEHDLAVEEKLKKLYVDDESIASLTDPYNFMYLKNEPYYSADGNIVGHYMFRINLSIDEFGKIVFFTVFHGQRHNWERNYYASNDTICFGG